MNAPAGEGVARQWPVWVCERCDAIEQRYEQQDPFRCNGDVERHPMRDMKAATVVTTEHMDAMLSKGWAARAADLEGALLALREFLLEDSRFAISIEEVTRRQTVERHIDAALRGVRD